MPLFSSKNMQVLIQDASGKLSVRVGPGPGDASWPDLAHEGKAVANIMDRGSFIGRITTEDLVGEVTVNLHHVVANIDQSAFFNAVLKRGVWEDATTCDPGGQVWAPSILIQGEVDGEVFAIRWPSCRPRVSGARVVAGNTLSFAAEVVGEPLYGDEAIAWPTA